MTIAKLGFGKIRVPDFQELNWHLPLNENFQIAACTAANMRSKLSWSYGFDVTIIDSDTISLTAGCIICNGNFIIVSASGNIDILSGNYKYITVNASGTLAASATFPVDDSIILYFVTNTGELIASDLRSKYKSTNFSQNLIINGQLQVTNRGTSKVDNGYITDRWLLGTSGSGTATATIVDFAVGGADVIEASPPRAIKLAVSGQSNSNSACYIEQKIEDVKLLSGKRITVSWWANSVSAGDKMSLSISQVFGYGGSALVQTFHPACVDLIVGTYTKYSLTIDVPSISGKVLGTGSNYTSIVLWCSAGSTYSGVMGNLGIHNTTKYITNIQATFGNEIIAFPYRHHALEDALCRRYYQSTAVNVILSYAGNVNSGANYYSFIGFTIPMRTAPTVVLENSYASGFPSSPGTSGATTGYLYETRVANATGLGIFQTTWTADAEL